MVFVAVEATQRHAAGIGVLGIDRENGGVDPCGDLFPILGRGLIFVDWRHQLLVKMGANAFPSAAIGAHREDVRVVFEVELTLVDALTVAIETVAVDDRQNLVFPRGVEWVGVEAGQAAEADEELGSSFGHKP